MLLFPVLAAQQRRVWAASGSVTVTANPGQVSFAVGSSANTTITVASLGGFSGSVSLAGFSYPYQELNVSFNPTSVVLTAGGTATATTKVSGNSTTTPAKYQIDIEALVSGIPQATAYVNATVTPGPATVPDFRLSSSLDEIPVPPTGSTAVTISVASLAGFSGDVSFTNPIPLGTLNATTVHLNPGQIANLTLTLVGDCPFASPNLRATFEMDATTGARFHWIKPVYFYQALTPTFCFDFGQTQTIVIGSSSPNSVTFGAFDGFDRNVVLSAQSTLQVAFFPSNNITVHQGLVFSGEVQFAVTVPLNTVPGNYTVKLTGTSGSQSWSRNQTVEAVTGSYFTMTLSQTSVSMAQGSTQTLTLSLSSGGGFERRVNLFPIFSNKSYAFPSYIDNGFLFSQIPTDDFLVAPGQTSQVIFSVSASSASPGSYGLLLEAQSVYSPLVSAIQIVQITVTAGPLLGISPLMISLIIGGVAAAGTTATACVFYFSRRRRLSPRLSEGSRVPSKHFSNTLGRNSRSWLEGLLLVLT